MKTHYLSGIEPEVINRVCGGWLALTPRAAPVRLGAVGLTEEAARANFAQMIERWAALRDAERLGALK